MVAANGVSYLKHETRHAFRPIPLIAGEILIFQGGQLTKRPILFLYVFLLAWTFPSGAQVINGFSPQRAVLGSSFTLTIRGAGFSFPETVQFSPDTGITVVSTTVLSSNQITAQVHVGPQAATISYSIKVLFAARAVTAPGTFQVTDIFGSGLPPPILNSIGPSLVSQGSQNVRLILNGRNFRPGATVVISPPLSSTKASTARAQATDVAVQSVVQLNDTLLLAQITVSQRAVVGARAVDVVNADGTSSGPTLTNALGQIPGSLTSQPFNISTSNSLAAPLNVATIAISYPRNGTVITQGDDIYGGAVLAGTGTGVITGVWLWDGNPFEQFAVSMTGGASVRLKTSRSLPSIHIGQHTLTVHVTSPNQLQTRDVDVVVNPGNWKLEKLLAPPPDAGFSSNSSPLLQWALIPAADHYQVGLATEPFYNSVDHWYDVNATEWRVPQKIWHALPEKQLYWTVRVMDISGDTRKPAPLRAIWRLPEMPALQPLVETREGAGIFLTWQALQDNLVYRVAISRNQDGTDLVRRFLTRDPKIYVRADRLALGS